LGEYDEASEQREQAGGGAPMKPEKTFPFFPHTPEGALVISSAPTVVSFLSHIFSFCSPILGEF
jgi:hypothetical protein